MKMVNMSLEAYVEKDEKKADECIKCDDIVDELFSKVKQDISKMISEKTTCVDMALSYLMIAKYFERIGKDISVIDKTLIEIKKEIARLENERKKLEKSESNFKNIQKLISAFNKRSETILPNITSLSTETEYDELLNEVKKIILTRPAVEAGENLGFLPGDLKEKVDPYLRPLYDALYDMLGVEQTEKLMEKGVIEIAPLAYMRGRTLEDAYVILDEAQNTTDNQMKMFLTRLGFRSKMIVTGDISQIDLPRNTTSGLIRALDILEGVKGISFIHLSAMDVVRHPVVQRIIERYDGNNE